MTIGKRARESVTNTQLQETIKTMFCCTNRHSECVKNPCHPGVVWSLQINCSPDEKQAKQTAHRQLEQCQTGEGGRNVILLRKHSPIYLLEDVFILSSSKSQSVGDKQKNKQCFLTVLFYLSRQHERTKETRWQKKIYFSFHKGSKCQWCKSNHGLTTSN